MTELLLAMACILPGPHEIDCDIVSIDGRVVQCLNESENGTEVLVFLSSAKEVTEAYDPSSKRRVMTWEDVAGEQHRATCRKYRYSFWL